MDKTGTLPTAQFYGHPLSCWWAHTFITGLREMNEI